MAEPRASVLGQVVGNGAPTNPRIDSVVATQAATPPPIPPFEQADATLAARPESLQSTEPRGGFPGLLSSVLLARRIVSNEAYCYAGALHYDLV